MPERRELVYFGISLVLTDASRIKAGINYYWGLMWSLVS